MLNKQIWTFILLALILTAGLLFFQSCGDIEGEGAGNRAPTVEIVNVPPNAADSSVTNIEAMPFTVSAYGTPLAILSMVGARMLPEYPAQVYALDLNTTPPETTLFSDSTDYTVNYVEGSLTALANLPLDSTCFIDFTFRIDNYYVFSYAPVIHWVGFDEDGFIDHYEYADITDAGFIDLFDSLGYTAALASFPLAVEWHDTAAMEARIYLLTAAGDTTEHLFMVRAYDNTFPAAGSVSQPAYKYFYRSNHNPNNPEIKPQEVAESEFALNYTITDTLFCLDNVTPLWPGIAVNWRGSDPDDKELIQIPLEFTYYLTKTPGDTLWAWSDSTWSDNNQIALSDLESGSYVFSVWVRDDAFALCEAPATITFNVVRPTFQYHILLVDETAEGGFPLWNLLTPGNLINEFWMGVLDNLEGQLDHDNFVLDGVDVRYLDNSQTYGIPPNRNIPIPHSLIGQYKLVIIYRESHTISESEYVLNRQEILSRYLDIGGRVWFAGRMLMAGAFLKSNEATYGTQVTPIAAGDFLGDYMQLSTGFPADQQNYSQLPVLQAPEFLGAFPVLTGLQTFEVDSNKVNLLFPSALPPNHSLMVDIDWYTRTDAAQTIFTYNSISADSALTTRYVYAEDDSVAPDATPVQATIYPVQVDTVISLTGDTTYTKTYITTLLSVSRVVNVTKGDTGQVISQGASSFVVSYPYGKPWSDDDSLAVDYVYDPTSEKHQKPVAVRYEKQAQVLTTIIINGQAVTYYSFALGYRTALCGFPLYFMKNDQGQVTTYVREMLNWFFYPTIHWSL